LHCCREVLRLLFQLPATSNYIREAAFCGWSFSFLWVFFFPSLVLFLWLKLSFLDKYFEDLQP